MILTDEQWRLLEPLFPAPPDPLPRGRPPIDDRRLLDAILWKLATHAAWYDLPPEAPPHQTVYRYYRQWRRSGFFDQLIAILGRDLHTRGAFDLQQAIQNREIIVIPAGRRMRIYAVPHLRGTWQLATALVILALAEKRLRRPAHAHIACDHAGVTPPAFSLHAEYLFLLRPPRNNPSPSQN